jgi:CheY-like chemotaxis protein
MPSPVLLVAEDDESDALLLERALRRAKSRFRMVRVADGDEAIDYVRGKGAFGNRETHPLPDIVLLDLKMPRKDGFAVLRWRQQTRGVARLPVIAFSSSDLRQDIDRALELGANSYVVKPTASARLEAMVDALHEWWGEFHAAGSPLLS